MFFWGRVFFRSARVSWRVIFFTFHHPRRQVIDPKGTTLVTQIVSASAHSDVTNRLGGPW